MSQNTPFNPNAARNQNHPSLPIPIGSAQRPAAPNNDQNSERPSYSSYNYPSFQAGSDISRSQMNMSGIDPPPNSLVTSSLLSSYRNTGHAGNTAHNNIGGPSPPPNTPAQPNQLHQIMSGNGEAQYNSGRGADQPFSSSYIRRRIYGNGKYSEPKDVQMDESKNDNDEMSPSSPQFDNRDQLDKYQDGVFELE
ncbi:hypothetical protein GGI25_004824 [Coemansia spiralis]|uniref:Uncharacterized protein n=2 Tax=Coemansia TaxID=4863 RepID=A0A9W8KWB1_9FUNG|nr:hypothetical protein EDC05_004803 [Coemansia umbellata]KAJ2620278.1 hypothetical protein GGI26_005167 [Coemansia sp. RSA 1358]KAJ2673230.1 hypothetical protein GGI25_004824 [Coemansia spiralis]